MALRPPNVAVKSGNETGIKAEQDSGWLWPTDVFAKWFGEDPTPEMIRDIIAVG